MVKCSFNGNRTVSILWKPCPLKKIACGWIPSV